LLWVKSVRNTILRIAGYGNIAPQTFWGRLVCIAYAVLGIPLMLLCLANIGDIMADVFRYVYFNVFCCGCNCFRRRVFKARPKSAGRSMPGGESATDAWKNRYNNQSDLNSEETSVIDDDDDEEDEDEEESKISVPLTITIGMLAFYVFMGALLFGVWQSWDWLVGSYFCFVTISTIGFGDFVPGFAGNIQGSTTAQFQMIGTAIYMVFGMALMSMAFNLIQEEMVGKFKWVGEKMGIVEADEDEEDEIAEDLTKSRPPAPGPIPAAMRPGPPVPDRNKLMPPGGPPKTFYPSHGKSQ